jgi:acyl CoA:acetate/3-ketoacid CoA transferase
VIARALAAGIGIPETVSQIIYEMGVDEFLKLTEGFPALSRVDFK